MNKQNFTQQEFFKSDNNPYLQQINSLKKKIRQNEANRNDMINLCEQFLKNPEVQKDSFTLGGVYFTYGLYLAGENKFDNSIENLLTARAFANNLDLPNKRGTIAGIDNALALSYRGKKDFDKMVSTLKYIIENDQDINTISAAGEIKEQHTIFAVNDLGSYYLENKKYSEGLEYLNSVNQKYPDSRTAYKALAQIYDIQMEMGDIVSAKSTKAKLDKQLSDHPDYNVLSQNTFEKWKSSKQ